MGYMERRRPAKTGVERAARAADPGRGRPAASVPDPQAREEPPTE